MEEVDKIILDTLKFLNCDIDDDIKSLKQFNAETTVSAISSCLEVIIQNNKFTKKLPPSMSARLKLASYLAEQIKDLGFCGEMGYQTILYCNEDEVRKVLMFLLERLPRESTKNVPEQLGYVSRIIKSLEEITKRSSLNKWVPVYFLKQGGIHDGYPLKSIYLDLPTNKQKDSTEYRIHYIPELIRQCPYKKLIPSLLFHDNEISDKLDLSKVMEKSEKITFDHIETTFNIPQLSYKELVVETNLEKTQLEQRTEVLTQEVEDLRSKCIEARDAIEKRELELSQLVNSREEEDKKLKEIVEKIKLKTKTATVLDKEENLTKLRNMIENTNERLQELARQWNEMRETLVEEHRSLITSVSNKESVFLAQQDKLKNLQETETKLKTDITQKKKSGENLLQQYQELNRTINRNMYTKRILEIIGNINKQNFDIQKVLKDTKSIQKEIKNLSGQVDRSFTLADELIFYDAKHDEIARRSYKLLVALREDFGSILKTSEDLGVIERECRNLEEQIEFEKSKEMANKLEKVYSDLKEIQKEIQNLRKQ
ncbi:coiled-coil domain-containing protein 22-like [Diorhabda carinulata]|uniref:coiled-coil domain-containing protein 22-like n=1 Tax=Diorhabda carinulata TaxID=1163345 RepID=UPI0025A14611|nr:coiled-coil domain-containing protein 22-like [Diorhabda carinulata]